MAGKLEEHPEESGFEDRFALARRTLDRLDKLGTSKLHSTWLMAFGRTGCPP